MRLSDLDCCAWKTNMMHTMIAIDREDGVTSCVRGTVATVMNLGVQIQPCLAFFFYI